MIAPHVGEKAKVTFADIWAPQFFKRTTCCGSYGLGLSIHIMEYSPGCLL